MIFVRCRQAVAIWSESQDRPASFSLRAKLWLHCLFCSPCRRYIRQAESVRKSARLLLDRDGIEKSAEEGQCLSAKRRAQISRAIRESQGRD